MKITTQRELRRQFWEDHPRLPRRRITNHAGTGKMYPTDTRVAFVDFIDAMCRNGVITSELAQKASLE